MVDVSALPPLIPLLIIVAAGVAIGSVYISRHIDGDTINFAVLTVMGILLGILFVFLIVTNTCMTIHPYEQFDNPGAKIPSDPVQSLIRDITAAEQQTCQYITRTNDFIQSDVGLPGQNDPSLVSTAIENKRQQAGGALLNCDIHVDETQRSDSAAALPDILDDAANRITRLEHTVNGFTGPQIQASYKKSDTCASVGPPANDTNDNPLDTPQPASGASVDALRQRLTAVTGALAQQKQWLSKIDEKIAALNRGEVSDCDKSAGASQSMSTLATTTAPAVGT